MCDSAELVYRFGKHIIVYFLENLKKEKKENCFFIDYFLMQQCSIYLESLFISPHLSTKCICEISSRIEGVSCTHSKLAKSSLSMPNRFFCHCHFFSVLYCIGRLMFVETRHVGNLKIIPLTNRTFTCARENHTSSTTAWCVLPLLLTSLVRQCCGMAPQSLTIFITLAR